MSETYIDSETDARLHGYGIQICDCPSPFSSEQPASKYLAEHFGLDAENRVACGCGQETIYYFDLADTLHFEGKHWHEACLLVELADRLWRKG